MPLKRTKLPTVVTVALAALASQNSHLERTSDGYVIFRVSVDEARIILLAIQEAGLDPTSLMKFIYPGEDVSDVRTNQ